MKAFPHEHNHSAGELNGIKAVCDFIKSAKAEPAHELARGLLVNLGRGNRRSDVLHRYLIDLLHTEIPQVQRTAAQVLRQLLQPPKVEGMVAAAPDTELVGAVGRMFCSNQVHVLFEAQELGLFALGHQVTMQSMVRSLVAMLRPDHYSFSSWPTASPSDADMYGDLMTSSAAFFDDKVPPETLLRQSSAARVIASFLGAKHENSAMAQQVVSLMIQEGVVSNLLVTAANGDFMDSRKNGVLALNALLKISHTADQMLHKLTGSSFHTMWHADAPGCAGGLTYEKLNQLFVATGNPREQYFKDRRSSLLIRNEDESAIVEGIKQGASKSPTRDSQRLDSEVCFAVQETMLGDKVAYDSKDTGGRDESKGQVENEKCGNEDEHRL